MSDEAEPRFEVEITGEAPPPRCPWSRRTAKGLALLVPLLLFLWLGERGLDFGRHWDETLRWQSIRTAVQEETLLPDTFNYPSMSFWVSALALAPEVASGVEIGKQKRGVFLEELASFTGTEEYHLRLRRCFLWLSALSLFWVWLAMLSWRGRWDEALLAASLLGLSWEVGYHARWAAPDVLMMMFSALCVMALLRALEVPERRRWLWLGALAAGLATGTKYNAGLLLLPLLGVGWATDRGRSLRERLVTSAQLFATFSATFLVTTPGAVLRPLVFLQNVRFEMRHYGELGHYGFTVGAGRDHLSRILEYVATVLPSPYLVPSLAVTLLVLVGVGVVLRESRGKALLLVGVPLLYVAYVSTQRVMFVRNLLFLAPFGAVLAARGAGALADLVPGTRWRRVVGAAVGVLLLSNLYFGVAAAETIRDRKSDRFVLELGEYLAGRRDARYFVTPQIAQRLKGAGVELPASVVTEVGEAAGCDYFVGWRHELRPVETWPGLMKGGFVRVFGPSEVNLEYYATWPEPHVVVLESDVARSLADLEQRPWLVPVFGGE